jgi:glutathione-independent formaldehyde dehydrogenase
MDLRKRNTPVMNALRPEERKMRGVMCGIDAVGYQAHSDRQPDREDATMVIRQLAKVVNPMGHVGLIGVYFANDPAGPTSTPKRANTCSPSASSGTRGSPSGWGRPR